MAIHGRMVRSLAVNNGAATRVDTQDTAHDEIGIGLVGGADRSLGQNGTVQEGSADAARIRQIGDQTTQNEFFRGGKSCRGCEVAIK